MKLTRRQLMVAASAAAATQALAQTPAAAPETRDFAKEARDNVQNNGDKLAKFAIPQSVEPAFQFKA